jgi:hypothetical protein
VRKSSVVMMAIVLLALGSMLVAGNSVLAPLAQDAERGKELTRYFGYRGDLVPETRVRFLRVRGSENRLAAEGRGLLVEMTPATAVRSRPGGLDSLTRMAARMAVEQSPGYRPHWVEVVMVGVPGPKGADTHTLVRLSPDGLPGDPVPALPATAPTTATPAAATPR